MSRRQQEIGAVAVLLLTTSVPAAAQRSTTRGTRDFRIDAAHSTVAFSIGFLGFPVHGRFDDVRGAITYVAGDATASSISVVIATRSIATGSEHRDQHLRSADFFDAAQFPYVIFQSRSVTRASDGYVMTGPLTMHGVTRAVSIPFREMREPIEDSHGSTLLLFSARLRLNRQDFGIRGGSTFNSWFDEARRATMSDSVDIALDITAWDPDYTRDSTFDRAVTRIAREGVDSAVKALRATRTHNPEKLENAEWELSQVGRTLVVRRRLTDAVTLLRFVVETFPQSTTALCGLARALEEQGDRSEAATLVRRARALDPSDPCAMELARRLR